MSSSGRNLGGRGRGRGGRGRGRGGVGGRSEMVQEEKHAPQGSSSVPVPPPDFSRLSLSSPALDVAPPPIPTSTKAVTLPQRPGNGRAGKACVVMANHFVVSLQKPGMEIFHYDIKITPELTSKRLNRMIISEFVRSYRQSHLGNLLPAFDGRKNLYTAEELPFLSKEFVVNLKTEDGSGRERKFTVAVKFVVKLDFDQLSRFLGKNHMECPVDVIQFLDIVLRASPTENHLSVGRSFFSLDFAPSVQLGNGVECWKGYYQSLRPTQMGLSLNIDLSATSFIEPLNVIIFIERVLGLRYMSNKPMTDSERTKVRKALKGVRVAGMHRPGHKIQYRITGISSSPVDKLMFEGPEGVEISVSQFFREKYKLNLRYKAWPCLKAGSDTKPSYLPMEVCDIVQGQRYVKKLNENQVRQMLTSTCLRPSDRQKNIVQTVCNNGYSNDAFLKEFGLSVNTSLTTVNARVLPAPQLVYKDKSGRETTSQPRSGAWNMMHMQIVQGGIVDGWACLNFSRNNDDTICKFTRTLVGKCQNMGMKFVNMDPLYYKAENPNKVALALQDAADYFKTVLNNKNMQLMIVVLPDVSGLYGKIKTICETDLGIVTQCCKPRHVFECKGQYQENLALKINVKVGGCNTFVSKLKDCFPPLPRVMNQHQAHTFGQVPAMEDGEITLFESRAISQFVAHTFMAQGTQFIFPQDKKKMSGIAPWMEVESTKFDPIASKLVYECMYKPMFGRGTPDEAVVAQLEEDLCKVLDVYEARLGECAYLSGDDFGLPDLHHLPTINCIMKIDSKKIIEARPNVSKWAATILARPSWTKVLAQN